MVSESSDPPTSLGGKEGVEMINRRKGTGFLFRLDLRRHRSSVPKQNKTKQNIRDHKELVNSYGLRQDSANRVNYECCRDPNRITRNKDKRTPHLVPRLFTSYTEVLITHHLSPKSRSGRTGASKLDV